MIIPGSVDCNRGDQALVWTAIDLIEAVFEREVEIRLLTEAEDVAASPSSCQTYRRGYAFNQMILDNPNRVFGSGGKTFHRGRLGNLRVILRAAVDFLHYGSVLWLARWPAWVKLLLTKDKFDTYQRLRQANAVVIKGGGFMYAYRSRSYAYYLWYVCYHTLLAQRLGVPVVILPNSFGPFETPFSRRFIARLLDRCALVTTRESRSQQVLDQLIPHKAKPFPDMAFLLKVGEADLAWARKEFHKMEIRSDGTAVGITMRPWRFPGHAHPQTAYDSYLDSMVEFIRHLRAQGLQPVLIAHVRGPGPHEMDRLALDECRTRLGPPPPILIDSEYDCVQMKALYAHLGYMVGTRFHSCIFAMAQAVPTLAIGYQGYKAFGIMADMGLEPFFMDIGNLSAGDLAERFASLQARQAEFRAKCRTYIARAEARLRDLVPTVRQSLNKPVSHAIGTQG